MGFDFVAVDSVAGERWFIEVKRVAILGTPVVDRVLGALQHIATLAPPVRLLIVTPGIIPKNVRDYAERNRVLVWGKGEVAQRTSPELLARYRGDSDSRTPRPQPTTVNAKANKYTSGFRTTPSGFQDWAAFQRLVADTFEFLFVPPLGMPDYESADAQRRDRRDFVMENSAENGVWAALRTRYNADYIPIDSKNSTKIGKKEVVLTAHYLKPYGLGMLAFVVCRGQPGKAAEHAVREQWIGNGKLIVILTDEDMVKMIELRSEGAIAEDLIRLKIANFRKSL
jgi:hypothetical protein